MFIHILLYNKSLSPYLIINKRINWNWIRCSVCFLSARHGTHTHYALLYKAHHTLLTVSIIKGMKVNRLKVIDQCWHLSTCFGLLTSSTLVVKRRKKDWHVCMVTSAIRHIYFAKKERIVLTEVLSGRGTGGGGYLID